MCDECDWAEYLEKIEDMLNDHTYKKSFNFLEGVYDWVEDNQHITDRQKEVVDKIYDNEE